MGPKSTGLISPKKVKADKQMTITFEQAREAYRSQAELRSIHTLSAYLRAIDLFLICLNDRSFEKRLPIQRHLKATAEELLLSLLSRDDEIILCHFARWLQTPGELGGRRPYASSTVELRMAGVLRWFEFMEAKGWLPSDFSLESATQQLKEYLQQQLPPVKERRTVEVSYDLTEMIGYYASLKPNSRVRRNPEELHKWELTRLRNHALLQTLAETAGQVSAILSLNVGAIPLGKRPVVLDVMGKSGHVYQIELDWSLPAVESYLKERAVPPEKAAAMPLFVSHDARYQNARMSRIIAWRVVQRAARATGLPSISPHDLRHWRARQLIEGGASPEEVRQRLGHRSIYTVRAYYGHIFEETPKES